jgi:hypothetical protein
MSEKNKQKLVVTTIYLLVFIGFFVYNIIHKSWFAYDAIVAISLTIFFYYISNKLNIGWIGLLFANFAVFSHNLGSFDAYKGTILGIGYDTEIHFFISCIAGVLAMKIIPESFNIIYAKKSFRKNFFLILSVISIILFFGVIIEFMEFTGFSLGVNSTNMWTPTDLSEDSPNYLYKDTIEDLFANVTGTVVGIIIYFLLDKKKKYKQ